MLSFCQYSKDVSFKLQNTCLESSFSASALSANFFYKAKYYGEIKNNIVGLNYQKFADTKKDGMQWFWLQSSSLVVPISTCIFCGMLPFRLFTSSVNISLRIISVPRLIQKKY
jgi:hypothetical protein